MVLTFTNGSILHDDDAVSPGERNQRRQARSYRCIAVVSTSDIRQDLPYCVNPEGASVISVVGVVGPISSEVPKFLPL